jgi:hypothetical protein
MLKRFAPVLACLMASVAPVATEASTLPRADFASHPLLGVGLGMSQAPALEGALSYDMPLTSQVLLGASVGYGLGSNVTYDVRALYRFIPLSPDGPAIAGILGVWGAPGQTGFQLGGNMAPFVGVGLAYAINDRFDARVDLSYSPFYNYGNQFLSIIGGPPIFGGEVGYKFSPTLQATLGLDGRGDIAGLSLSF